MLRKYIFLKKTFNFVEQKLHYFENSAMQAE